MLLFFRVFFVIYGAAFSVCNNSALQRSPRRSAPCAIRTSRRRSMCPTLLSIPQGGSTSLTVIRYGTVQYDSTVVRRRRRGEGNMSIIYSQKTSISGYVLFEVALYMVLTRLSTLCRLHRRATGHEVCYTWNGDSQGEDIF